MSKKYNNNSWKYLILITGFGNFHNLGTSESKLYDHLMKKLSVHLEFIEFIFKIFNEPFTEETFSIAIDIIEKSYDSFCGLRDDPYSMLPISNPNPTSHY